jgi:hypothetical protein
MSTSYLTLVEALERYCLNIATLEYDTLNGAGLTNYLTYLDTLGIRMTITVNSGLLNPCFTVFREATESICKDRRFIQQRVSFSAEPLEFELAAGSADASTNIVI